LKKQKKNKTAEISAKKKKRLTAYLFLLTLIPFVLYIRIVNFGFTDFDDQAIINSHYNIIGDISNIKEAFTHDAFMSDRGDLFYRPVQTISFMTDALVGGQMPWIYHLTNLLLHIITTITLFFFLKRIGIKEEISFLLSLCFSIHPLLTHTIAWIPARGDLLAGLFSLVSFIAFLKYIENRKIVFLILHSFVFLLALFSKEISVLVPVLIIGYYYFMLKKPLGIKDVINFIAIWLCSLGLFYYLRHDVVKVIINPNTFGIIPFIQNLRTIPITFGKFFVPLNLTTLPFFDNIAALIGIILLVLFSIIFIKYKFVEKRVIIWGSVWFLAFTIPPMFFRAHTIGIGFEYFEYRAYLPMIGILIILGIMAKELPARITFNKILKVIIPVLLIFGYITYNHSSDFANPFSFFSSAIDANPFNAFAISERGSIYLKNNNIGLAIADYDYSIKLSPEFSTPYYNKGALYSYLNDHNNSEHFFSLALKYDTLHPEASNPVQSSYIGLSSEKLSLKKYDEAIILLNKAVLKYPDNGSLHNNLGKAFYAIAEYDSAMHEYIRAIKLEKNNYEYYNNRGLAEFHMRDFKSALNDFNTVLILKPDIKETWGHRGMTKVELNDNEGAIDDLTQAMRISKPNGAFYYYRGVAFLMLNKLNEAKEDLQKSLILGYKKAEEKLSSIYYK
jgi:protein O-mannosyl-transferase